MSTSQFNSHQVEILYNLDPNPICVGTLISSYLVLTVFSCLAGKNKTKLKARALSGNRLIRNVESIHSYPALKSDHSENDVAVLLLDTNLQLGESLTAMEIIEHNSGKPEELIALSSCGNIRVQRTEESDCVMDNPNLMCVKLEQSDSCPVPLLGAGLICRIGGIDCLCGALAKTRNGTNVREYTDISKYLNWIRFTFHMASDPNLFQSRPVSSSNSSSPVPYQLSLQDKHLGRWRHICGAVIIDEKTALTAAHCFDENLKMNDYRIVAGITQLNSSSTTQQILPLRKIIRHFNYQRKKILKGNDIAILHVEGSFVFNENVQSIWISPPDGTNLTDFPGKVSGWRKISGNGEVSNSLQETDVRILSDFECRKTWPFLKPSMICTYDQDANICEGDSGGPLVIKNYQFNPHEIRDRLVGIVSFSPVDCEKREQPTGFTEISYFYDWIKDNRNLNEAPESPNKRQSLQVNNKEPQLFTVVSSLFFTPGTDYKVFFTVNLHPKNESLQLKCVLMANSSHSTIIESESISLRAGESGQISIPLPREMPGNETVWRLFAWRFTEESWYEGYKYEAPHTLIRSSLQNADPKLLASVFVQTDKPAYKPGDLIRIRVITMDSNDLPHLTAGVNLTVVDSHRNVMKKWEQPLELPESASQPSNVSTNENAAIFGEFQKKKNGLSSYEYQLPGEAILGNWLIYVEAGNIAKLIQFEVQKYILPQFQVKIHAPSVLYGSGKISAAATIKASYTYGKGLQGTGTVIFSNGAVIKMQQFVVKDGEGRVNLSFGSHRNSSKLHTITANVTEKNTGRWQIGKAYVGIYPQETYSVQWINKPSKYKPGLPLAVQLKITTPGGFPVKDVRPNSLRITFPPSLNLTAKETSIPLSGIATFTFLTPLQRLPTNSKFQVEYKRSTFNFTLPAAARGTPSGIFIEILSPPDSTNFIQDNKYKFTIRSNKPIQPELFHCFLWDEAAMNVYGAQTIVNNNPNETAREFPFTLQLPKSDYNELKLFVYFETQVGGRGQIISTYKSIHMRNYLKIRVSPQNPMQLPSGAQNLSHVDTSYNSTVVPSSTITSFMKPGDAVQIHFETYPDSTIAIGGIETSLLLAELDPENNNNNYERATPQIRNSIYDSLPKDKHSSTQSKNFRRLGVSVLSNERFNPFDALEASAGETLEESEMAPSENLLLVDEPRIPHVYSRHHSPKFSETWLWEEFESSSNSNTSILSKVLPDTLTSWSISGFSLNPRKGLGVASPATITGFMPFFVTLNLPYSVVKYETFDLQVIVHNYLDREVNVVVTLFNRHADFEFEDREERQNGLGFRSIKVERNQAALARFVITPMVIGEIPIEVKAVTEDGSAGDSILRHLKVKPDGVRKTRSQLVLFEPEMGDKNQSREVSYDVEFPKNVVRGGSSLQLTVIGEPTYRVKSNLSHLLQLPYGTGETVMMKCFQNVVALRYLTATNSDAKDVMQQAKRNLEQGYANQLKYRTSDGSFAVWEYLPGTTWLTSYVLRWLVEAQKYVTIDNSVIKGATDFLLSRQRADGSFLSLVEGPRYHPELCLYNCNGLALTAYITLALIKVNETSRSNSDLDLQVAIQNGMNFISKESVYQLDDKYITNLVAATLMAGNHPEGPRFFEKMENGAKTTTNEHGAKLKYWDMENLRESVRYHLAIEMTSFALLAHLWKKGRLDSSVLDIHRWLLWRRNSNGGFKSTHDTMMGLTALTEFALRTKAKSEDQLQLNIRASSSSNSSAVNVNDKELTVTVARWNRRVFQEFHLPASTKKVNFHAVGSGSALIQLTETWHVPIKMKPTWRNDDDDFNIIAIMTIPKPNDEPSETELTVCINSLIFKGVKESVASIQLPSGYTFSPEHFEDGSEFMKKRPRNIQRFELKEGNTKVEAYYNEIARHPPTCVTLPATQQVEVANARRPSIVVYDYSNPDVMGTISYRPAHTINPCQLCNSTKACIRTRCL